MYLRVSAPCLVFYRRELSPRPIEVFPDHKVGQKQLDVQGGREATFCFPEVLELDLERSISTDEVHVLQSIALAWLHIRF